MIYILNMNLKFFNCIHSQIEKNGQFYSMFKIGTFKTHLGITFANSLRRVLLADTSRCTFNAIKISGIEHEYSNLVGVRESVVDIIFNLDKIIFLKNCKHLKPQIGLIDFKGPGIVRAKHIHLPKQFKCIFPNQYIATIETDGHLKLKLFFCNTKQSVEKISFFNLQTSISNNENYLFSNKNYCSVEKVNYTIQSNGFIFFEIWTNGSISPQKIIYRAVNQVLLEFLPYSLIIRKYIGLKRRIYEKKKFLLKKSN